MAEDAVAATVDHRRLRCAAVAARDRLGIRCGGAWRR